MERYINQALTPSLLKDVCAAWGIAPERCRLLGDFENFVYEVDVRARPAVLRLTHVSHRTASDIEAELDFAPHTLAHTRGTPENVARATGRARSDI